MSEQYLVVLSHGMDDVPIEMFSNYEAALEHAKSIPWEVPEVIAQRLELPEMTTPCCIFIWCFVDGKPKSRVLVRDHLDEEDNFDCDDEEEFGQ